MSLFFADLVRVACHATGTGSLLLGEPMPGHRGFELVPPGAHFHYAVLGVTHPGEWETGEGMLSGGALQRTPLASSAAGAAVDFSPGLKTVALTVAAAWFAEQAVALAGKADLASVISARRELIETRLTQIDTEEQRALSNARLHFAYGEYAQ